MKGHPTPAALASEFSRVIREWLDDDELDEVVRRNGEPRYEGCCATHDFCDANEAMQEALASFDLEFQGAHQQELIGLINEAWDLARARRFSCEQPTP